MAEEKAKIDGKKLKSKVQSHVSNVDCSESKRGVWLVKVPKYLSEQWKGLAGQGEIGRLSVGATGNPSDVLFRTTRKMQSNRPSGHFGANQPGGSNVLVSASSRIRGAGAYDPLASCAAPVVGGGSKTQQSDSLPDQHQFIIGNTSNLTLAVFSEDKTGPDSDEKKCGRLCLEGRVVKRAECRPPKSLNYMKMKMDKIVDYSRPTRQIKTMDRAVTKFKPVAIHQEMVAREKQKKEGKNVRMDKDRVLEKLFEAFEKHQYYKLTDLANVTNQPASYIKELLNEIGRYNTAPPHKFMWELKPEYRHYSTEDQEMVPADPE